ncbi:hypothetical protein HYH03_007878 [Edaphochlamys debaryana]|uniref:Uncharacterized protein n=1 Tax=Edaphochlamys debaryana TaxID=47281 RepID=A0A836C001_9CHLO|nr:hypothetical protein HYH03_007878 [Edaphochlamys debaryana]|eukprot:KAG2493948.1 hypothetical protein HYH03_007878 [Edaphochlamys debaryana]
MAPPSDPVVDVWRSPELLGCVASFLDPSHAAWSFIRVNKAAAAAAYGDNPKPVPRTVRLGWALSSELLATPEGRIHARTLCYRLTYKQRVKLLCRVAAADCSRESLEGAMVAAGLSPPPLKVLVAAASTGRLAVCRWLVEDLGCPGLVRLACLCLVSAAGPGPGVVEEARAWLAPAALEWWSEWQEAKAASGDLRAVKELLSSWRPGGAFPERIWRWYIALCKQAERQELRLHSNNFYLRARVALVTSQFFQGPDAALAVTHLTQMGADPGFSLYLASFALHDAAKYGHAEAVRFLLSRGARPTDPLPAFGAKAASGAHVDVLRALHEAGCMGDPARCFQAGLEAGSLPVVEWLVGTFGAPALSLGEINHTLTTAARSGSVQLLKALPRLLGSAAPGWDRCRGACWANAAASGCEEAVEWLAKEAGAPDESRQDAYREAASQGDLRMVQRLRRLGCPYSAPDAEALAEAARRVPASAAALPWLEEPGCPASWGAAAADAAAEVQERARAQAQAGAAAQEAKAKDFVYRAINLSLVIADGPAVWAMVTGGVDPCGPGLQTWGWVRYRLLVLGLPLAVMAVWLHVRALPLRKLASGLPIGLALTQLAASLLGVPASIRLAITVGFGLLDVDGRRALRA